MQDREPAWLDELPQAFKTYRADRDVDEVECIVPDLAGMSRGKAMPLNKFHPDHETYLPISIFYQTVTGRDVEMDIVNQWAEGDVVLKADMTTVPYKGTAPAMTDLLGGQVDFMCDQTTNTTSQIAAGKVKAYAVTTSKPLTTPALRRFSTNADWTGRPSPLSSISRKSWARLTPPGSGDATASRPAPRQCRSGRRPAAAPNHSAGRKPFRSIACPAVDSPARDPHPASSGSPRPCRTRWRRAPRCARGGSANSGNT